MSSCRWRSCSPCDPNRDYCLSSVRSRSPCFQGVPSRAGGMEEVAEGPARTPARIPGGAVTPTGMQSTSAVATAAISISAPAASGEDGRTGAMASGPGAEARGSRTLAAGGYRRPIRDGCGWASHGCGTAPSGSRKTATGRLRTCLKRNLKSPPSKRPPIPRPLLAHCSPPGLRPPARRRTRHPKTLEGLPRGVEANVEQTRTLLGEGSGRGGSAWPSASRFACL